MLSDNQLYTGFTGDIKRRIEEHRRGNVVSARCNRPLKLIHFECYTLKSDAKRREKSLKKTEGKRLLQKQIRDILVKESII